MVIATQNALYTFSNDFPAQEHYLGQVWQFLFCEKIWVENLLGGFGGFVITISTYFQMVLHTISEAFL